VTSTGRWRTPVVPADTLAPVTQPALTRDEFTAALYAQGARYWDKHPFHVRLNSGGCTPAEVRRWVLNRWYYQANLSRKNAAVIAGCPLPEVRRRWVDRITFQDDGGLDDWVRLAEAVGVDVDEMTSLRSLLPGVRFAVDAYVNFCRTNDWALGAAAALTELFSPDHMSDRVSAWREHYPWIGAAGYAYFETRIPVVRKDSDYTLNLVLDHCADRVAQEKAVAALALKCDVLWAMLDAIEHAGCPR
jgi:pyrroloquinoline-quinone synthase